MPKIEETISEFIADRALPSVAPADSVAHALEVMRARGCDAVVVMNVDRMVGIFTERDFLNRVAAPMLDVGATAVEQVMTAEPDTLSPSDSITYAINRMAVRGFRNIPIARPDGSIVAVLTVRDVVAHLSVLFDELRKPNRDDEWQEWTDLGGGA